MSRDRKIKNVDGVVSINGEVIPDKKRGKKVKLQTLLTATQITDLLWLGKEAGEKLAAERKAECLSKENKTSTK